MTRGGEREQVSLLDSQCVLESSRAGALGRPNSHACSLLLLQLEFAVQMTCQSCVDAVGKSLKGVPGKSQFKSKATFEGLWTQLTAQTEPGLFLDRL